MSPLSAIVSTSALALPLKSPGVTICRYALNFEGGIEFIAVIRLPL
jgi:hypothetical protein